MVAVLRNSGVVFCRMYLNWVLYDISNAYNGIMVVCLFVFCGGVGMEEEHKAEMLFSLHHSRVYTINMIYDY